MEVGVGNSDIWGPISPGELFIVSFVKMELQGELGV